MAEIRWKLILRDALIIFVLTFAGGILIRIVSTVAGREAPLEVIGCSNIFLGAVGFCISGARQKTKRFNHLFKVAVAVWLLSLVNVIFWGVSFALWSVGIFALLLAMVLGGAVSYLFVPKDAGAADGPVDKA